MNHTNTHEPKYVFVYTSPQREEAKREAFNCALDAIESGREYLDSERAEQWYFEREITGMSQGDFVEHTMVDFSRLWRQVEQNAYNPREEHAL